jgi:hypothetical protein
MTLASLTPKLSAAFGFLLARVAPMLGAGLSATEQPGHANRGFLATTTPNQLAAGIPLNTAGLGGFETACTPTDPTSYALQHGDLPVIAHVPTQLIAKPSRDELVQAAVAGSAELALSAATVSSASGAMAVNATETDRAAYDIALTIGQGAEAARHAIDANREPAACSREVGSAIEQWPRATSSRSPR